MFTSNEDVTVGFSIISNTAGMTKKEAVKYIAQNKGAIELWGNVEIKEEDGYYYDGYNENYMTTKVIGTSIYGTFTYEDGTEIEAHITAGYNEGLTYVLAGAGMMNKTIKDYTIEADETGESGDLTFREIV